MRSKTEDWSSVLTYASSAPIFLWLRERAQPQPLPAGENYLSTAFKQP